MNEMFVHLLARLRALYLCYQTSHWQCGNLVFYEDHLLFDRLVKETFKAVDKLAEKGVGLVGRESVNLTKSLDLVKELMEEFEFPNEPTENAEFFKAMLKMEESFQEDCTKHEADPVCTLGFKNLIAGMADKSEGRTYLLKRRLSKEMESE